MTISLAMIGKFGIAASFAVFYVFVGELLPTVLRSQAMGIASFIAGIGLLGFPYIVHLVSAITGFSSNSQIKCNTTMKLLDKFMEVPETRDRFHYDIRLKKNSLLQLQIQIQIRPLSNFVSYSADPRKHKQESCILLCCI
jgi:hypothetical protein